MKMGDGDRYGVTYKNKASSTQRQTFVPFLTNRCRQARNFEILGHVSNETSNDNRITSRNCNLSLFPDFEIVFFERADCSV